MHIATIIPIARGIPFDVLTYYTSDALAPGTLVSVPFGKQTILGIVIEHSTLAEAKAFVKGATFSLKKITAVLGTSPYFTAVAAAIRETSARTLVPFGAVAGTLIPQALSEYVQKEKISDLITLTEGIPIAGEDAIVGVATERLDQYKRLVRTAFAAKKSVLFIAPSIRTLEYWHTQLQKGIAKHTVLLHSKITKRDIRTAFTLIRTSATPLIIFATPGFSLIPRTDLGYLCVEHESSNLYRSSDRFMFDSRIFFREFATGYGLKLFWGDTMPRLETLARVGKEHLPRTYVPDKLTVVPIDSYRTILPSEVIETIRHAQKKKQRLYIYASRKGVAPLSRCSDCGTVVICPTCELPMVLRNKTTADGTTERSFVCMHCGDTLSATHVCTYCGSWNITPVAIGTESIRDAVASLVGPEAVITIDDDLTPDSVQIAGLLDSINAQKFAIIIGTIKALPFIKQVHYALFPFFDRLLSTPSLSTTETVLRLIMECNERASEAVLLFTRDPEFPLIRQLATQKINDLLKEELALRKDLGYPPYGSIIKVSVTAAVAYRERISEALTQYLSELEYTALPARRVSPGSMKVLLVWIIKAPLTFIENDGPDLRAVLDSLHFPYAIEENPDRL